MCFLLIIFLSINLVVSQNYAPGELIVKYKDNVVGLKKLIVNNKLTNYDIISLEEDKIVDGIELYNLKFNENIDVFEMAKKYESFKEVEYAEPNFIMENFFIPNDSIYNSLYWTKSVNAENAWDLTIGNKNIRIGILDTGVDWNHPDLYDNILNGSDSCSPDLDLDNNGYKGDCRGYDFVDINVTNYINEGYALIDGEDYNVSDNDPMDFEGHGTHVAGISGAVGNNNLGVVGSCWNCSIIPIRAGFSITSQSGNKIGSLEVDDVISAIYYAADNNISILSMSFGGGDSSSVKDAIKYAYNKGVILVASAGNSGANDKQYPCGYDEVICVGALNSDDSPASYSNYGDWIDLTAPGTGILSTGFDDSYISLSGTSMSAPMVSGMIGLIKSLYEENQTEILKALKDTGKTINFSGNLINKTDVYYAILSFDNINPIVNLVSPENQSLNSSLNQNFICNASDDLQLQNISLKIWNSSSLFYNESRNISGNYNSTSFSVNLENNSYEWNCLVYDANNNKAYASENFSFSTIVIKDEVTLNFPENNSYTNLSTNYFSCSIKTGSKEINNLSFIITNSSNIIYQETKDLTGFYNSSNFSYDFSDDGIYYWNCNGYTETKFSSNNFTINYDSKNPVVTLLSPENDKIYENKEVEFIFNVSEYSNCLLNVNDKLESELNNILDGSFKKEFEPGDYNWKIICEDYAKNNAESETRNFIVSIITGGSSAGSGGESGSSGSTGGSGGGGGGGSSTGSAISGSTVSNSDNSNQENINEIIEENLEDISNNNEKSDITGLSVDKLDFNLNSLDKYKNRIYIVVVLILIILIFLFYLDLKYEQKISKEIELLEKE